MGKGQPRFIFLAYLIIIKYLMVHTKFQASQPTGSGEEDFWRFLPNMHMGMEAILAM